MDILGINVSLPAALENQYVEFLFNLAAWLIVGAIAIFVIDVVLRRMVKKTETKVDDILLQILRLPVIILVFLYGFVYSFSKMNFSPGVEHAAYSLYRAVLAGVMLYLGWVIYRRVIVRIIEEGAKKKKTGLDRLLVPILDTLGKVAVLFVGFMVLLGFLGVDVGILMASFGVAGLVVALAAQDTLSNLFSGIHLLLDRPFQIGDVIMLEDGDYYEVKWVGMRSTRLYNLFKNTLSSIPNSVIAGQRIVNISAPDSRIKIRVDVGVAYDSDVDKAKKILLEIAGETEHIMKEDGHMPFVRVTGLGDSSVNLSVFCWVDHYDNQWKAASDMREKILARFREEGIEIPFPQHVVYLKKENS